eukprot:TRINITY_DN60988_c0_g1_i1.p1 TRINITY_DN60988_c0_g1~~TRINITY_DN60988_c0_g1_i1.p1  ORF type:complete len:252 (-),score=28.10 TRINITY_DN60988_c0_g1_i1:18-698(-)
MLAIPRRLTSGDEVRAFLLGRWALSKRLDYRVGGGRGSMTGTASFTESPRKSGVLIYEERGLFTLEGLPKAVEAYKRYCFNTCAWPVEVYFVDDPTKVHIPTLLPELDCHTSFFVALPFGDAGVSSVDSGDGPVGRGVSVSETLNNDEVVDDSSFAATAAGGGCGNANVATFEHLCIDDLYKGTLTVCNADAFEWNWAISGPQKDGSIYCSYQRLSPGDAATSVSE